MKIAKGIAMGLEYLHTMETPVIHRDIKSANILIDHVSSSLQFHSFIHSFLIQFILVT